MRPAHRQQHVGRIERRAGARRPGRGTDTVVIQPQDDPFALDALETEVDIQLPSEHISKELITSTLESMLGESLQTPPVYSAQRHGGMRAYEYAREGKEIKMRPHAIEIFELDMLVFDLPELRISVRCSKGTYVRSLARDIGTTLGSGAHLTALRRTRIGDITVDAAMSPKKFAETLNNL